MNITPIEIRKKSFEKAFRGYEKEEVDAFLKSLSQEWEKLNEKAKDLKRNLEVNEKELKRLRDVEVSLINALKSSESSGVQVIEQANKAAELHVKEAQILAESLINEAKQRARNIIEEAEENAGLALNDAHTEVKKAFTEYSNIEDQTEYFLQSLQSLAKETLERVDRYKGKSKKNELEHILKNVKNISVNRTYQDEDFIKVELPKIQMPELAKPRISTETSQSISEFAKPVTHTSDEQNAEIDHISEQEMPLTDKNNQHQDEEIELQSEESFQEKEINKQEEEDQHKGSQGSFFDSI